MGETGILALMAWVQIALQALSIVVGLVLLWAGIKKVHIHSYLAAVLTFMDVAALVVSTVYLGWIGFGLFVVVNAVALIVTSIRLAARKEELLTYAATQFDVAKSEMYDLFERTKRQHRIWKTLGPINCSAFIAAISQRGRSITEAEMMLVPMALLWFNDRQRIEIETLTEKFDRLLRLAGEPADQAMRTADILTESSRQSAISFSEILDGMLSLYSNPS